MTKLPTVVKHNKFIHNYNKLDNTFKIKVNKQLAKIVKNPDIGKPMKHNRKGTRELYVKPFRVSYAYYKDENKIVLLNVYHKDKQ